MAFFKWVCATFMVSLTFVAQVMHGYFSDTILSALTCDLLSCRRFLPVPDTQVHTKTFRHTWFSDHLRKISWVKFHIYTKCHNLTVPLTSQIWPLAWNFMHAKFPRKLTPNNNASGLNSHKSLEQLHRRWTSIDISIQFSTSHYCLTQQYINMTASNQVKSTKNWKINPIHLSSNSTSKCLREWY